MRRVAPKVTNVFTLDIFVTPGVAKVPVVFTDSGVLPRCSRHSERTAHGIRAPIRVETVTAAADTGVPLALPAEAALVRTKLGRVVSHTGELACHTNCESSS